MLLRILGCGTIKTPQLKNCAGYLINDEFLLDCGPGIWRSLAYNNINNSQIKYIGLSHFHADHVYDLAPILLERYLTLESQNKKLILMGPLGLRSWFTQLSKLFGEWMQSMSIEIFEIDSVFKIEKYIIHTLKTGHTDSSICYRIEDLEKKVLFYSGDTDKNENLKVLSKNADIAIFEASNTGDTKIEGHLTPEIAAEIANTSSVRKLVLTHFYPEIYNSDCIDNAKKFFLNEVLIAKDNMIIKI
jgi:ribonuclease BN (tRNA processing enzyme)